MRSGNTVLVRSAGPGVRLVPLLSVVVVLCCAGPVSADFSDTAIDWDLFDSNPGYTIEYTYLGDVIADHETSSDPSNGGSAVSPATVDIASCSPGADPGSCASAIFGYYNGGTPYDPDDPSTMDDDYVFFRLRMVADPTSKDGFGSRHYNMLLDVDGDGYKEFWVDVEGDYTQTNGYDRVNLLYDDSNNQGISDPDVSRVAFFTAYHTSDPGGSPPVNPTSHTRAIAIGDGSGDWWVDVQIPVTAFDDLNGNQVLYPDSPVAFFYSTSTSNTDPLQKDHMMEGDFLTLADPITFGDIIIPNGQPVLELIDADRNFVSYYSVGADVHVWVSDRFSNTDSEVQECITVTVSDPATGDDELVTLCETGTATGIFVSDRSGACVPEITYPDPPPDPVTARTTDLTASTTTLSEGWTVTYSSGSGTWTVAGSLSGTQTGTVSAGTPYTSDGGELSFTLVEDSAPSDGTVLSFCTMAADVLTTSTSSGSDDDGDLQVVSEDEIVVSYTNPNSQTVNDTAVMLGPCTVMLEFTRANGFAPEEGLGYELFDNPGDSDKLYLTVTWPDANDAGGGGLNPSAADTLTGAVTLCRSDGGSPPACVASGGDVETLTLVETGASTGVFRNSAGLSTTVASLSYPIDDENARWEGVDNEVVIAVFNYECPIGTSDSQTTSANLFYIDGGGRVAFTNGAGTQDVEIYSSGEPVFLRVTDENACSCTPNACTVIGGVNTLTVTVTSTSGDSETVTVWETASGSGVFMNRENDLVTTSGSGVVSSASSTFSSDGLQPGDTFIIATGPDRGTYEIDTVDSETQLTLTQTLSSTRSAVGFSAAPLMTGTYDGTSTGNDSLLEAADEDTLTVSYSDCDDGDTDTGNDAKTDTATYNAPSIVINAVLFYPDTAVSMCQTEYVELYNSTNGSVNVTGYEITDEDSFSYTIPQLGGSDIVLLPGERLIVSLDDRYTDFSDSGVYYLFTGTHSTPSDDLGDPGAAAEGDRADQLSLYDSSSTIIDYVAWSDTTTPSLDFKNDDTEALNQALWQDDFFTSTSGMSSGQVMARSSDGFDTNSPDDWGFSSTSICMEVVTRAFVVEVAAYREHGRVVVRWRTTIEDGTIGFELQRRDDDTGQFTAVNSELIPALAGSPQGGTYYLVDPEADVNARQLQYRIAELEARPNGSRRRLHGPYTLTPAWPEGESEFDPNGPELQAAVQAVPPGQLRRLETHGYERSRQQDLRRDRSGSALKIVVREPGLYLVTAEEIAAPLGLPVANVMNRLAGGRLSLYTQGEPVAWLATTEPEGLLFWGTGTDSPYTADSIYWLFKSKGIVMETVSGPGPSPASEAQVFSDTVHREEQVFAAPAMVGDPEQDFWFWKFVVAGNAGYGQYTLPVELPGVADSTAQASLLITLRGATETGVPSEHHVAVAVNGSWIGEGYWQGLDEMVLSLSFAQALLHEGENSVTITGELDTGAPYSVFYLDSFALRYQRHYTTTQGSLVCRGNRNRVVTVRGLPAEPVRVLDISNELRPRLINATTVTTGSGSSEVSFRPETPGSVYLVSADSAARRPPLLWADSSSDLLARGNAADYLLIAPAELLDGARQLAELREKDGLQTMVVDIEDVYDQLNHGLASPWAIRNLLVATYGWVRSPRFVVLVGSGSFDYRGYGGSNDNLVPAPLAATASGLFPADILLADLHGEDAVPEMAIGRIPVLTAEELSGYLGKITAYEAQLRSARDRRVVLVADDNPWGQRYFRGDSEAMAAYLPALTRTERIYLPELPAATARERLLAALAHGASWLSFVGHSGLDRITDEGLLLSADVPVIEWGRTPLVTAFTCTLNRFDIPGFASLGETLVWQPDGGAVAVWAPSGLVADGEVGELGTRFFAAMNGDPQQRLGDVVVGALSGHAAAGGSAEVRRLMVLLGDPALPVQR